MTLRKHLTATAVALAAVGAAMPSAQAQTLSVSKTPGSPFVFTVSVTPSATINTITFDFNGNVAFTSATGVFNTSPYGPAPSATNSSYTFFGPSFAPQTFGSGMFTFTPAAGSTATTYNVTVGGPTFAAVSSGSLAAPEPGSLVSMAVLGTCLGLGIVAARRRKMLAS